MDVRVWHFMIVGKVASIFIQEMRRQVVTGVYLDHCGVSRELEDLISILITVKTRYISQRHDNATLFQRRMEAFPKSTWGNDTSEATSWNFRSNAICSVQNTRHKDSLHQRTSKRIMASICLLEGQSIQVPGFTTRLREWVQLWLHSLPLMIMLLSL